MATHDRIPYVGAGEDGARRSARIDREKAETLAWDDRRHELLRSADDWEEQAHRQVLARTGPRPDLTELRMSVGSETWLAAIALLDLSPALANDAASGPPGPGTAGVTATTETDRIASPPSTRTPKRTGTPGCIMSNQADEAGPAPSTASSTWWPPWSSTGARSDSRECSTRSAPGSCRPWSCWSSGPRVATTGNAPTGTGLPEQPARTRERTRRRPHTRTATRILPCA